MRQRKVLVAAPVCIGKTTLVKKIFSARRQGVCVKSIFDRSFHYTPSTQTDLRKTFARIRREQREQIGTNRAETQAVTETRTKIVLMRRRKTNWGVKSDGSKKAMNSRHIQELG